MDEMKISITYAKLNKVVERCAAKRGEADRSR